MLAKQVPLRLLPKPHSSDFSRGPWVAGTWRLGKPRMKNCYSKGKKWREARKLRSLELELPVGPGPRRRGVALG